MPASIGSIPKDATQEDFVPMGMAAAWKTRRILRNAQHVVAAEFLCAAQGIDLLRPLRSGPGVEALYAAVRDPGLGVPTLGADRPPAPDLARLTDRLAAGALDPEPDSAC